MRLDHPLCFGGVLPRHFIFERDRIVAHRKMILRIRPGHYVMNMIKLSLAVMQQLLGDLQRPVRPAFHLGHHDNIASA